jgi:hypothetical protein
MTHIVMRHIISQLLKSRLLLVGDRIPINT